MGMSYQEEEPMLTYDPIPWLMTQAGLPAVRARRLLGLDCDGDEKAVRALERKHAKAQLCDGSFQQSPMKTAGVLNLLDDLRATDCNELIEAGASYLISVLESQPGYQRARTVRPGSLRTACDLCGFFGPYQDRSKPEVLAHGAREMNFYREYEPLLAPRSPVRGKRRSSLDRPGPGSCYAWGLIPISYTIEALCRAGHAHDQRLQPATNALLGAQRESGGWCRSLGGHPSCTIHALRAIGPHPKLRRGTHADKALQFMRATQRGSKWWKGSNLFATIQAVAMFDLPVSHQVIREALASLAPRQQKNGTFGGPCRIERVAAMLIAKRAVG